MKTPHPSFLLFSLILSSCFYHSLSEKCNSQDKKVLLQIKEHFNNPYVLKSWNASTDCCDWYCVSCDRNTSRINLLKIFQANLSGEIPPTVGDLPYLETLWFRHLSNLTGEIPQAVTKLKNLKQLRLSYTNLSGPVPDLSQLKNLTLLELSSNNLTGTIPNSLSSLQNLNALHLDRNKLTGSIPDSFGNFTGKVPELYLSHNLLSGHIPSSLGDMDFNVIDLSRNKLVGDASMLFGSNKTTLMVDISRNSFEFDLTNVVFPNSLTNLDINHNKINGSLPAQLTSLKLQAFNVSYNRLCGQIPVGGSLQNFNYTEYFHNKCLCGEPLPACL